MGINSSALEVCIFFASMAFQNNLCLLCVVSHLERFHKMSNEYLLHSTSSSSKTIREGMYRLKHSVSTEVRERAPFPFQQYLTLKKPNFFQRVIYFLRNCWTVALGELSLYLELDVAKLISKNNLRLKRLTFMSHLSWFHEGFTIIELLLPR